MAHPIFKKIWKSAVIQIYKNFCWFLIQGRLNTRSLLFRESFHLPSYQGVLCNEQIEETTLHLFLDCSFSLQCWDLIIPNKKRDTSVTQEIMLALNELPNGVAMNIVIMGCLHIWMQRNNKIFKHINPITTSWKQEAATQERFRVATDRTKHYLLQVFQNWIATRL